MGLIKMGLTVICIIALVALFTGLPGLAIALGAVTIIIVWLKFD